MTDFVLSPATAEIVLHVSDQSYPVPILVSDLVALPASPVGQSATLDELLLLLGRRIGAERAIQMAEIRAKSAVDGSELGGYFGEGFEPTDVFRAWWSAAEDLVDPVLSVPAFRLRLEGSLGIGAAWKCMVDAVSKKELTSEEVWFYGAELLRSLGEVSLQDGEDQKPKHAILAAFTGRVAGDLNALNLDGGQHPWVKRIVAFYRGTGR